MKNECLHKSIKIKHARNKSYSLLINDNNSIIDHSLILHKSFLETFLNQIKSSQYHFLINNPKASDVKQYLQQMKNDLQNLENEKKLRLKNIEEEIRIKNQEIYYKLYNKSKNKNNLYNSFDDINKAFQDNISDMKIDYINEIEQLKTLSFKIENEIAQVDFEFKKKISSLLGLKIARLYQEEDLELTTQNKKVKSIATHLMKEKLGQLKKILISKIKTNLKISEKENKLLDKINKIKINQELKKNKYKQYLLTNNTIFEEDENKSTEGKNNDDDSDNEKIDTKNKHSSNCLKFNNINIDFKEITEKIKTKMLRSLSNESAKRKNMQFFTNNNLHVNINLNLNIRNLKIIHRNTVAAKYNKFRI